MDRDFHFGATYFAAREAKFSSDEAMTIAQAAQYVDEFDYSAYKEVRASTPKGTGLAQTVQTVKALAYNNLMNWSGVDSYTASIWPVFHFLPGKWADDEAGIAAFSKRSPDSADLFPLVCGPYGPLADILIYAVWKLWQERPDDQAKQRDVLIRIGITLHVLADTFAHANFVGVPSCVLNDVQNVTDAETGIEITLRPLWDYSPAFSTSSGYGYIGHGRIGHLPDQPWLHYRYVNSWLGSVDKNNPVIYTEATKYLIMVLEIIQSSEPPKPPHSGDDLKTLDFHKEAAPMLTRCFEAADSISGQEGQWSKINRVPVPSTGTNQTDIPAVYTKPTFKQDAAFITAFAKQAWEHRDLVMVNCRPLRIFLSSDRTTS